jgi:integrase/recombinase XerC
MRCSDNWSGVESETRTPSYVERKVYRSTFTPDQRHAILAGSDSLRDSIALRLLLDYGLRKGSLCAVQFKHFDHQRRRVTIFAKGQKVREVPIPDLAFWKDLERHILEAEAKPDHFLLCPHKRIPVGVPDEDGHRRTELLQFPEKGMSEATAHRWWYRCLAKAGVVEQGVTSGEKMHKARHSAGQRVLDATGNLKAVQKLLNHASIQTTADIYVDWDLDQLAETMAKVLADDAADSDDSESFQSSP